MREWLSSENGAMERASAPIGDGAGGKKGVAREAAGGEGGKRGGEWRTIIIRNTTRSLYYRAHPRNLCVAQRDNHFRDNLCPAWTGLFFPLFSFFLVHEPARTTAGGARTRITSPADHNENVIQTYG